MAVNKRRQETSKTIVVIVLILFALSMAASYTLPILFDSIMESSQEIFKTASTLTGSILIGYFGKAGFENYDKNKKFLNFEKQNEEPEGGNG